MIICLDQEKAYNRILHPFLWRAIKKFEILENFINMVKALYSNAYMKIILNREMSKEYRVTKGV